MKIIFAALAMLIPTATLAADAPPKVPTGYEVKGCNNYVMDGTQVIQVCNATGTPKRTVQGLIDPTHPIYVGSNGTDGGADK